jgi:hypothetical protein
MLRNLALGLLLLAPGALVAQEGSIAYKHVVRLDIPPEVRARLQALGANRPGGPGGFPTERVSDAILIFNPSESLMKPVPPAAGAPGPEALRGEVIVMARPGGPPPGMAGEHGVMMQRMRMGSATRRDRETIVEAYVRYEDETIVESREFLGRTFLIEDERPAFAWKLTGEQAEFLGYLVQKATAQQDSTTIEAWFTPQIPIPGGPAIYGGLPGMILTVSLDGGQVQYTATQVALSAVAEGVIVPPTKGEKVDRARYEQIVAEKLQELRTVGGDHP